MGVVVQGPMPVFRGFSPRTCFSSFKYGRARECAPVVASADAQSARAHQLEGALLQGMASYSNVRVFRPWPLFCDDETCTRGQSRGRFYFMDEDHLSVRGSVMLLPDFLAATDRLLGRPIAPQ